MAVGMYFPEQEGHVRGERSHRLHALSVERIGIPHLPGDDGAEVVVEHTSRPSLCLHPPQLMHMRTGWRPV